MVTTQTLEKISRIIKKEKRLSMKELLVKSKSNYNTVKNALIWLISERKIRTRKTFNKKSGKSRIIISWKYARHK